MQAVNSPGRTPVDQTDSRPARFDLNVPLSFKTEDGIELGHCINVSATGMLAAFHRGVDLFTEGILSLVAGEYFVTIHARVARVQSDDHGLAFHIANDNDRLTVKILLDFAIARHQPT